MLETGDRFPEFSLAAHDGSTVSSRDLAGSAYLLYFYPKANTPACTREACAFRDRWDDAARAGLRVFGVSFDAPENNRSFADKHRLPFPLLSDTDRELARAVGAKMPLLPVPRRISYLVGADGRVVASYPTVRPDRHADEVLEDWGRLGEGAGGGLSVPDR